MILLFHSKAHRDFSAVYKEISQTHMPGNVCLCELLKKELLISLNSLCDISRSCLCDISRSCVKFF